VRTLTAFTFALALSATAQAGPVVKGFEFGATTMEEAEKVLFKAGVAGRCDEYRCELVAEPLRYPPVAFEEAQRLCRSSFACTGRACKPTTAEFDACVDKYTQWPLEKAEDLRVFGRAKYTTIRLGFTAQKTLAELRFWFDAADFLGLLESMSQRWGKAKVRTEKVQNGMGAVFENAIATWDSSDLRLQLTRYCGDLDTACVTIESKTLKVGNPTKEAPKF